MPQNVDITTELNELRFRRNILESLLVSSRDDSNLYLPSIEEFILSEVINGAIKYVGARSGEIVYRAKGFNESSFEKDIAAYFASELASAPKKLDSKIESALIKLTKPNLVRAPRERPYYETELYHFFKGFGDCGVCPVIIQSTFSLLHETVLRVNNKTLPKLSLAQRSDVEGISKAMAPFIAQDLKFIQTHYHW